MPAVFICPMTSAAIASESSNCWSKCRVRNITVFSSSRSPFFSARSRNSPIMIIVPTQIAATRTQPLAINQKMGSRRCPNASRRHGALAAFDDRS